MELVAPLNTPIETPFGSARFDDLSDDDIGQMTAYYTQPDPHLDTLVDRARMPSKQEVLERNIVLKRTDDSDQQRVGFAIRCRGELAGFTILARKSAHENYSHWHIIDESLRAGGFSSRLYPSRIRLYFGLYPIERLIHQTKTSNTGVNRMLDKFVPVAETRHIDAPDGLSVPGEYHLRYVERADLSSLLPEWEKAGGG